MPWIWIVAGSLLSFSLLGINHLLSSNSPLDSGNPSKSSTQVVLEMAQFVEKNPEALQLHPGGNPKPELLKSKVEEAKPGALTVLGLPLDESTLSALSNEAEFNTFRSRYQDNPAPAVQDLKQAWASLDPTDLKSRKVLLEVTGALSRITENPEIQELFLNEVKRFHSQMNPESENLEYSGTALQHYLNQESDAPRRIENLNQLGIPHVVLPPYEDGKRNPDAAVPTHP